MSTTHIGAGAHNTIETRDFQSFAQLRREPELLASLIHCICEVFTEPGPWEEDCSFAQVLARLQEGMMGQAILRVQTDGAEVVAFCRVQYLQPSEVLASIQSADCVQEQHPPLDSAALERVIGGEPQLLLQDLGIRKDYRSRLSLRALILPVLLSLGASSRPLFFWSVEATCVPHLAEKWGIQQVYKHGALCFFRGYLPTRGQSSMAQGRRG